MSRGWLRARAAAAAASFFEDILKWLFGVAALAVVLSGAAALGIQQNVLEPPRWWPWAAAPEATLGFELKRNRIGGQEGYAFVGPVFDEIRATQAGSGSVVFTDERLARMRVCRDVSIAPQEGAEALMRVLTEKLDGCLSVSTQPEAGGLRFTIAAGASPHLAQVSRPDRGQSLPVAQYLCHCSDGVVAAFLATPSAP